VMNLDGRRHRDRLRGVIGAINAALQIRELPAAKSAQSLKRRLFGAGGPVGEGICLCVGGVGVGSSSRT